MGRSRLRKDRSRTELVGTGRYRDAGTFVLPASDTDGIVYTGSSAYQLPYGAHLRLRASFDISRFGPQSAAIARAMKTYGVYLADTAKENELYNAIAPDGADRMGRLGSRGARVDPDLGLRRLAAGPDRTRTGTLNDLVTGDEFRSKLDQCRAGNEQQL